VRWRAAGPAGVDVGIVVIAIAALGMSAVGALVMPDMWPPGSSPPASRGLMAGGSVPAPRFSLPVLLAQERRVRIVDFAFHPSSIQVAYGLPLALELVNNGAVTHIFVIPALTVERAVLPGERQWVRLPGPPVGVYAFSCAVPEHREAGMVGRLIVGPGTVAR
jgi:plastocyanin